MTPRVVSRSLQLSTADLARIRLHGVVAMDRKNVQCGRWVKRRIPRNYRHVTFTFTLGPIYRGGKPVYRWQVRR